jgi:CDGSH-type Zn-finger protein
VVLSEVRVTPYRNGPYLIRGDFTVLDQDGREIETDRPIVALCRCGKSQNRPFCDGTHKAIGFQAESGPERRSRRIDDADLEILRSP